MPSKYIKIQNILGLHLRAASKLAKISNRYKSDIFIQKDDIKINGKSILGIATLGAVYDSEVEIITQGPDARELLDEVVQLIERKFDEEV